MTDIEENQRDGVIVSYEMLTNRYVKHVDDVTYTDDAFQEMHHVYDMMDRLADLYGLKDVMKTIFMSFSAKKLSHFSPVELRTYVSLFQIDLPQEILTSDDSVILGHAISNHNIKRLQRIRWKRYVSAVFFDTKENAEELRPEIFYFPDYEIFRLISREDVLQNGVDFYFLRMGELTIELMEQMYTFEECLHIAKLLSIIRGNVETAFEFTNEIVLESLIRHIIILVEELHLDPRMYLTLQGPASPIIEEFGDREFSLMNNLIPDNEEIILACENEGITIEEKPVFVLFHEYQLSQLSSTFTSDVGKHRTRLFSLRHDYNSSEDFIGDIDEKELVYFGSRDGISKMNAYTLRELYYTFLNSKSIPFDPYSIKYAGDIVGFWHTFPKRSIKRLMKIIATKKSRSPFFPLLAKECVKILSNDFDEIKDVKKTIIDDIKFHLKGSDDDEIDSKLLREHFKMVLIDMLNAGEQLKAFNENFNQYDQAAKSVLVEKLGYLSLPEPLSTGRPQNEAKFIIIELQSKIAQLPFGYNFIFETLHIIRYYNEKLDPSYDNSDFKMSNFFSSLIDAIQLKMIDFIEISGFWLVITANVYHQMFFGTWISQTSLEDFDFIDV